MSKLINNLPYLIKAYRDAKDLTQKDLAALVGVDHTMVSRIETNADTQRIDLGTAEKFRKVIGFRPEELVKLVDE